MDSKTMAGGSIIPAKQTAKIPIDTIQPGARTKERQATVPGPRSKPILGWRGNVLSMLGDPVMNMIKLRRNYGDLVALGQEASAPICVFSPEYNHQVLSDTKLFYSLDVNSEVAPIQLPRGTSASRLLSGVAGMNGEKHTQHRRLLMPGFHKKRVDMLLDTVIMRTQEHIEGWQPGQKLNLAHEMVELSLSLAISGLIGLDPKEEGSRVRHLLEHWGKHGLSPQVVMLPYDVPGLPYRKFIDYSNQLEAEFIRVIERKRASGVDEGDALAIMLQAQDEDGAKMTDTELLGHLTTLFTAGHETTACALTWTLFLLSQHPHVMADLMDELSSKLGGGAPTLEQMRDLPVLDHVVNEGLRMFPPGMWMFRTSTAPFEMGGYEFPKGKHIVFSPAVTHRRPDLYAEPNRFMPERWEGIDPSTYEFLPFGGGPRRCLGATFATLELKTVIPIILQRFRLEVPAGTRVDRAGAILSTPRGGIPVTVRSQDRRFTPANVRGNIHDLVDFN